MSAYFVTHPMMDKTAVVHAPSTEKARTTFLDWLERNGLLQRSRRQAYRRDMVAEKLEDPSVPSDVVLNYGYGEEPEPEVLRLGEERVEVPIEQGEGVPVPDRILGTLEERMEIDRFLQEGDERFEESEGMEEPKPKRMPIQEVMLKGFS